MKKFVCGWSSLAWGLALLLSMPILALIAEAIGGSWQIFSHLIDTVLYDYVKNSLILLIGVCFFAIIWGVPTAYLLSRFDFFGRGIFRWALLLPMAMPAYVVAYIYTDIFDYAGIVQVTIRAIFGFNSVRDYWFFDMRSMGGAIFVLSLVFSPYVYLLSSLNFSSQSQSLIHAAKLLGKNEWQIFYQVLLPLARPAIAVGCTLVGMETLADYGTVAYFSVWHVTTAIYETWLGHSDLPAASKLSLLLLLFVVLLITLEKYSRRRMQHFSNRSDPIVRTKLCNWHAWAAFIWCFFVLSLGFLLPAAYILYSGIRYFGETDWDAFAKMSSNSLTVALIVALLAVAAAVILQFYQRSHQSKKAHFPTRLASLGYAVPGTVLAIGVLIVTTTIDHGINHIVHWYNGQKIGLIFSGTLFAIAFAFLCRFAAVAIGTVEAGINKIPLNLDHSAFLSGYSYGQTAYSVWRPLLRNSLLTAFMLVFLESMKELSAALLLRPFNVQTLATYIYEYMSSEQFELAALPSLVIVVVGLPPVLLLMFSMNKKA